MAHETKKPREFWQDSAGNRFNTKEQGEKWLSINPHCGNLTQFREVLPDSPTEALDKIGQLEQALARAEKTLEWCQDYADRYASSWFSDALQADRSRIKAIREGNTNELLTSTKISSSGEGKK